MWGQDQAVWDDWADAQAEYWLQQAKEAGEHDHENTELLDTEPESALPDTDPFEEA